MAPRVGVLEISQKMYSLKNMKFGAILFFMIVSLEVNIKWQQCSHGVAGIDFLLYTSSTKLHNNELFFGSYKGLSYYMLDHFVLFIYISLWENLFSSHFI